MRPLVRLTLALTILAGCSDSSGPEQEPRFLFPVPLTDIKANKYIAYQGGLYPGGANEMPAEHAAEGKRRAALVQPRLASGALNPAGKIVLLSIGFDNASEEFCAQDGFGPCEAWSFVGQAQAEAAFDRDDVALINGAVQGGYVNTWDSSTDANYNRIRDLGLVPVGLSEQQVQVVWMKMTTTLPGLGLPGFTSDAFTLAQSTANVVRALHARYPNLQMVFLSSRIYGGFSTIPLHPEPYSFEAGFATKWVIETQINQMKGGVAPHEVPTANLRYPNDAPWIAWGPYLWSGTLSNKRSDGLFWEFVDFEPDGFHPSTAGETKVAGFLLEFFMTSPHTRCWFRTAETCT